MVRAQVIRYGDIDKRFPERDPDSRLYQCRVLAEGDSWFTLGGVPSSNMLFQIQVSRPTALVTIAEPGDTIMAIGDPAADAAAATSPRGASVLVPVGCAPDVRGRQ